MSTRRPLVRTLVLLVATLAAAVGLAACGGGDGSGASSVAETSILTPPSDALQGCTYTVDNSVPSGMPAGLQPGFTNTTSEQASVDALKDVEAHGGRAIVQSFTLPTGAQLYPGPDSSLTPVYTVPAGRSVLVADPLVWKDGSGNLWLGFFIACGGHQMYWVSVDSLKRTNASYGTSVANALTQAESAKPFYETGTTSYLPVKIKDGHLVWVHPDIVFQPARGELLQA